MSGADPGRSRIVASCVVVVVGYLASLILGAADGLGLGSPLGLILALVFFHQLLVNRKRWARTVLMVQLIGIWVVLVPLLALSGALESASPSALWSVGLGALTSVLAGLMLADRSVTMYIDQGPPGAGRASRPLPGDAASSSGVGTPPTASSAGVLGADSERARRPSAGWNPSETAVLGIKVAVILALATVVVVLVARSGSSNSSSPEDELASEDPYGSALDAVNEPFGDDSSGPDGDADDGRDLPSARVVTPTGPGLPFGIAIEGDRLWLSTQDGFTGELVGLDTSTGGATGSVVVPESPELVASGAGSIWLSHLGSNITRVDPAMGAVVAEITTPAVVYDLVAADDAVWVSHRADGSVSRIDPTSNSVVATVDVGGAPYALVTTPGAVWVADSDSGEVHRIDPATNTVVDTRSAGPLAFDVAAGDGSVWVSHPQRSALRRFDAVTGEWLSTFDLTSVPGRIATSPGSVWIHFPDAGRIDRLAVASGEIKAVGRVTPGEGVIAASDRAIWFVNWTASTVEELSL